MTRSPEFCFYCGDLKPRSYIEMDHVPVPARHDGTDTVPACRDCHNLKDRVPLSHWPISLQVEALNQCGPLGRIFLAKAFGVKQDLDARANEAAA